MLSAELFQNARLEAGLKQEGVSISLASLTAQAHRSIRTESRSALRRRRRRGNARDYASLCPLLLICHHRVNHTTRQRQGRHNSLSIPLDNPSSLTLNGILRRTALSVRRKDRSTAATLTVLTTNGLANRCPTSMSRGADRSLEVDRLVPCPYHRVGRGWASSHGARQTSDHRVCMCRLILTRTLAQRLGLCLFQLPVLTPAGIDWTGIDSELHRPLCLLYIGTCRNDGEAFENP